jgi:hypothetical protein
LLPDEKEETANQEGIFNHRSHRSVKRIKPEPNFSLLGDLSAPREAPDWFPPPVEIVSGKSRDLSKRDGKVPEFRVWP